MKFREILTSVLVLLVALAAVHVEPLAAAGGAVLTAGIMFPVQPKTKAALERLANPEPVAGGQSEAVPWTLYFTRTYTSGTTTALTFFNETLANRELSNMTGGSTLPEPQYFEIYAFTLDVLVEPDTDTAWRDLWRLVYGGTSGAPRWTFNLADKDYGPWPVSQLCATGGPTGFGYSTATDVTSQYANNGVPGACGFWTDGSIVIPPQQGFRVDMAWNTSQILTGDTDLRVNMHGVLHRRVL